MRDGPLLECEALSVRFGGLVALADVSFIVSPGEVLGVIGPNGAGKTTLFNVICGIYRPTTGRVRFRGRDLARMPPHKVVREGITRTFQNSRLFEALSVIDNVLIGMHTRMKASILDVILRYGWTQPEMARALAEVEELLESVAPSLLERRYSLAGDLPQADRRRLEIARTMAAAPRLLLLDEPSAGMDDHETAELMADIRQICEQRPDLAVILIEHDMNVVAEVPDTVIVLDYGEKIAQGTFDEVRKVERVQEAYLGKQAHA